MKRSTSLFGLLCSAALASGCGNGSEPNPPGLDCSAVDPLSLVVGSHTVQDAQTACVRLPAASSAGAEYLYVALSTQAQVADEGDSVGFAVHGSSPAVAAVAPMTRAFSRAPRPSNPAAAFHARLRERERELSRSPSAALFDRGRISAAAAAPPVVGDQRTFKVCKTASCDLFVDSHATAKVVGQRVAIFLDDTVPSGGYSLSDLQTVGQLFDDHLYPIDTTAFGRETDIDNNGVVVVLLTPKVNQLSPNCSTDNSVILGYFFGLDLLPSQANSNDGEVFYGLVPDPNNNACDISKSFATDNLAPVFIHEFQHMISFGQHVVTRQGDAEVTWLNEGLSHFAEELGGRQVPDVNCPDFNSCADEFVGGGDLPNAFDYLSDPESSFLVEPSASQGELAERGANWLFVRWLADHFATDTILGTDFTRKLETTSLLGAANVASQTGVDFPTLVTEWQMANYLDHLPGFTDPTARLRYKSWNFRAVAAANSRPYPLVPDSTITGAYQHSGFLRTGSGLHVRIIQPASSGGVDFVLTATDTTMAVPAAVAPRIGVVRIR
ncbi:MAG: hypothetical protein ACJ8DC_06815 [Gemmatimonadales bacterium]